jgi:hypothetical protein
VQKTLLPKPDCTSSKRRHSLYILFKKFSSSLETTNHHLVLVQWLRRTSPFLIRLPLINFVQWQERNYLLRINRRNNFFLSVVATAAEYDHEKHWKEILWIYWYEMTPFLAFSLASAPNCIKTGCNLYNLKVFLVYQQFYLQWILNCIWVKLNYLIVL